MPKKRRRDVEKEYPKRLFIAKLRRLADALEQGKAFRIRVAGEHVRVPAHATISIEHERGRTEEELEFQLKWTLASTRSSSRRRGERERGVARMPANAP